jgi:hypothetical protein
VPARPDHLEAAGVGNDAVRDDADGVIFGHRVVSKLFATRLHIWRAGLKALPDASEANDVVIEDEEKAQARVGRA